jgi:dCTP deaminase
MIIVDKDLNKLIENKEITIISTDPSRPFDPKSQIGTGSIDLRIGPRVRKYKKDVSVIDLSSVNDTESIDLDPSKDFIIEPGELWLAGSLEIIILPPYIGGILTGRSSIARLGLLVECSQNFIHPGQAQMVPLQLINITNRPIWIKPYLPICQLMLLYTSSDADVPYNQKKNAKYRNELFEPQPSKIGIELGIEKAEDFEPHQKMTQTHNNVLADLNLKIKETKAKHYSVASKLRDIHSFIFVILGSSLGVFISEVSTKPFPSNRLILSAFLLFVSAVIIVIVREGRFKYK